MTNGLVAAIQDQVDPFFKDIPEEKKNRIYFFMHNGYITNDKYPIMSFIGQTNPDRKGDRFCDGDYSKSVEAIKEFDHLDVHGDLSDHYVRRSLLMKGCKKNNFGGSPEVLIAPSHIKSYSEYVDFLVREVNSLDESFRKQEETYGFTPESHSKKIKEKDPEATRAPKLHLVQYMTDRLTYVKKDAKIYVPMDAWGHFCKSLSGLGYTNIYTDKDYDMRLGMDDFPHPTYITQEEFYNMKFSGILGNPPFGKGGNLALNFLNSCADRIEDDGVILLVLPKSIKKGSNNFNKINRSLELVDTKDCDPKDFSSSIDACIQEWRIGEKLRPLEEQHKVHPHISFLSYERRYDADIFVGGDGAGSCGKVHLPSWRGKDGKGFCKYEKSSSHNYIQIVPDDDTTKEEIINRIISLGHEGDNTFRDIGTGTTNGIPHLGKTKLITAYVKRYGTGY